MARDVVFNLKVEDDPRNKGIMGSFSAQIAKLKGELDSALRGGGGRSGGGGGGAGSRGGGANDDLQQRIKLAGQLLNTQVKEEAKRLTVEKRMKDKADVEDRQRESAFIKWRSDLRIKSFQLEARENERLRKDSVRENRQREVETRRTARMALTTERRHDAATNRIFRGGVSAIGAIGGFVGGDTGSSLANVALGAHTARETYEAGKGIVGGIGSLTARGANGLPLAAGSNAAVAAGAPFAAGLAAAAGVLAAFTSAVLTAKEAVQNGVGGGAKVGGVVDKTASMLVRGADFLQGRRWFEDKSDFAAQGGREGVLQRHANAMGGTIEGAIAGYGASGERLKRQQAELAIGASRRQYLGQLGGRLGVSSYDPRAYQARDLGPAGIGTETDLGRGSVGRSTFFSGRQVTEFERQFGDIRRQSALSQMELGERGRTASFGRPALESQARYYAEVHSNTSAPTEQRNQAEEKLREIRKDLVRIGREEQAIATDTARARLTTAKQEYDIRKQMAEEAQENYKSDAEKFLDASPEERARIRAISQKQAAGGELNKQEAQIARGYNFSREYGRNQSVKLAERMGFGGDIAANAKEEMLARNKEAAVAKVEADKAQIELDNRFKIDVTLKSDEAFLSATSKEFGPVFEQMDKAVADKLAKLREEFTVQLNKFANSRRQPVRP